MSSVSKVPYNWKINKGEGMSQRILPKSSIAVVVLLFSTISISSAQIERFVPFGQTAEVWRITHDPTVRDWANYHNTQCWSPDGRYICYNHFASNGEEFGAREAAEVHIYDLHLDKDIMVDNGGSPRWANKHNWLFYTKTVPQEELSPEVAPPVMWLDVDTDRAVRLATGLWGLRETDGEDRWIYGIRVENEKPQPVRVPIREDSQPEVLKIEGEYRYGWTSVNPKYPAIVSRDRNYADYNYSIEEYGDIPLRARHHTRSDLDGGNRTQPFPIMEGAHFSWSGDGSYFLCGNGMMRGIKWDEFLPGNVHYLAPIPVGDVGKCGLSGRWILGTTNVFAPANIDVRETFGSGRGPLAVADLRSGDGRIVMKTHSVVCYPGEGDNSGPYDIDAKGSPDGTKIVFISNYDLKNGPYAVLTEDATADKISVKSTEGFPKKGELVAVTGFHREVLRYKRKTATSFEKLSRGLYGTPVASPAAGQMVTLFEARLIPKKEAKDLPLQAKGIRKLIPDEDSPLLRQRSSDVYAVVVRQPDRPYLRVVDDRVELIPGENHWEIQGYEIYHNDQIMTKMIKAGESVKFTEPGSYTAVAVEWSGLRSEHSHPIDIKQEVELSVLDQQPEDFSWTVDRWMVNDQSVEQDEAIQSETAIKEIVHIYDGVIHREWYEQGQITKRFDLNVEGKPTRRLYYEDGVLARRELHHRDGRHVSTEVFNQDGDITEAYSNPLGIGASYGYAHWWYEDTVPVKAVKGGVTYEKVGDKWRQVDGE
jgi:hypothetical protein